MAPRAQQSGFTLLEVMIAMSILAVGATSILSIFVAAVSFHTMRVEDNRITEIYNHAKAHAQLVFDNFEQTKDGPTVPGQIPKNMNEWDNTKSSPDAMIREAGARFPGFRYEIRFLENDFAVAGSSVVADIRVYRLSGQKDQELLSKEFLTRSGAPLRERFKSPSLEQRDKQKAAEKYK